MREYELTYLVSDDVAEADLKKVTNKVAGFITADGGKITKQEDWGRRKLAYPIGKQTFASYVTVWFNAEAGNLASLDRELRVSPQVIRHLVTLKVQKNEELKVTKEDIIETKDVEEVIGEKSFEVVQGETEASKDLMAVREKDEESDDEKIEELAKKTEEIAEDQNETATQDEVEEKVEDTKAEDKLKKTRKAKAEVKEEIVEPVAEPAVEEKVKKTRKAAIDKLPKEQKVTEEPEEEAARIKKLDEKLDELLKDDL